MTSIPENFVPQRSLDFGGELTVWSQLKYAHAVATFLELERRTSVWMSRDLIVCVPQLSEDQRQIHFILEVREQPPLDEWSLIFADGVHSLRSCLDALAWEIANLDRNEPAKPNQVYFPIGLPQAAFDSRMSAMGAIDPQFVERFRYLQTPAPDLPLQASGGLDPLAVIHQLDIDDKHRGALRATGLIGQATLRAETYFDAGTEIEMLRVDGEIPLQSGYEVGQYSMSKPAKLMDTVPAAAAVALSVQCTLNGETHLLNAPDLIAIARVSVQRAVAVMTGGIPEQKVVLQGEGGTARSVPPDEKPAQNGAG